MNFINSNLPNKINLEKNYIIKTENSKIINNFFNLNDMKLNKESNKFQEINKDIESDKSTMNGFKNEKSKFGAGESIISSIKFIVNNLENKKGEKNMLEDNQNGKEIKTNGYNFEIKKYSQKETKKRKNIRFNVVKIQSKSNIKKDITIDYNLKNMAKHEGHIVEDLNDAPSIIQGILSNNSSIFNSRNKHKTKIKSEIKKYRGNLEKIDFIKKRYKHFREKNNKK